MAKIYLNTPTYNLDEIENGKHPSGFIGESDYRHIRETIRLYPNIDTFPSKQTFMIGDED